MKNHLKIIRLITTPPCSQCKNCGVVVLGEIPYCSCEKYLDHEERVSAIRYKRASCDLVRGTRFCRFEKKVVE